MNRKFLILTLALFVFSGSLQSQQFQRPSPSKDDYSEKIVKVPEDMMVDIRETKLKSPINSKAHLNSCGNIGITPNELKMYGDRSTFIVNYSGFTPEAQAAFQHAVNIWSKIVKSDVPIVINAQFAALPPGVLGSAGPIWINRDFDGAVPSVWYPIALANSIEGIDAVSGLTPSAHISANFSSVFTNWYYGLDGCPPAADFDFVTVVLHEIGHGLGFVGTGTTINFPPLVGCYGFYAGPSLGFLPWIYDTFVEDGAGVKMTDFDPNFCSFGLLGLITGDDLFFNGPNTNACNGGSPAQLFAPNPHMPGSSYSHFNEATYPGVDDNSLMTPFIAPGQAVHRPGCTIGLFQDMGWKAGDFTKIVPTMGEWSLIVLGISIMIFGVVAVRQRETSLA